MSKVSIIIPSYSEVSKPYLDTCIQSIQQINYDYDLIDVIISTPQGYIPEYKNTRVVHHPDPNRQFAEAINFGVKESNPSSKYLFILNDDTIVTVDALTNLVTSAETELAVINPTSNCDLGWKYLLSLQIKKGGDTYQISKRFFKKEEASEFEASLMDAKSIYPTGGILTDTLALYATLIPRTIWEMVGELDEQFKTGYEDSDWCHRAKLKGIPLKIELSAIVWHYGGIATFTCLTDEQTAENKRKFEKKWYGK